MVSKHYLFSCHHFWLTSFHREKKKLSYIFIIFYFHLLSSFTLQHFISTSSENSKHSSMLLVSSLRRRSHPQGSPRVPEANSQDLQPGCTRQIQVPPRSPASGCPNGRGSLGSAARLRTCRAKGHWVLGIRAGKGVMEI